MSAYGFDRAVRQELRRLRKRRDHPLWVKAAARVVLFTVIWAVGALILQALVPAGNRLDFPIPPAPAAVSAR